MKKDRANLEQAEIKCREIAKKIGRAIKADMPLNWGFTLILYSYGGDGFMTYLSSGEREQCIKMLEEILVKIKNNEPNV